MTRVKDIAPRLVLVALVTMMLLTLVTPAAWADGGTGGAVTFGSCKTVHGQDSDYLLVNRYGDYVTRFHSRLDAKATADLTEKLQRGALAGAYMSLGNAIWQLSTSLLYASSTFCPIDTLGSTMDTLVASIGNALSVSGLLVALVAATVISAVWRAHRGAGAGYLIKEGGKTAAVLGVIFFMIAGATTSTQAGPGRGSPWWWIRSADAAVSIVSGKVAATASSVQTGSGYQPVYSGDPITPAMSCYGTGESATSTLPYSLYLSYNAQGTAYVGTGASEEAAQSADRYNQGKELPLMVSRLWESITLPTWTATQLGRDNPWADQVWCFVLEAWRGIPADGDMDKYLNRRLGYRIDTGSIYTSINVREDQSMIALAACEPAKDDWEASTVKEGWGDLEKKPVTAEDCVKWLGEQDLGGSSLDWDDDENNETTNASGNAQVLDYLRNLHGKRASNAAGPMFLFLVGSCVVGVVFGLLALLQSAAKVVLVCLILALFLTLVKSLAPGDDSAAFKKTGAQVLGASFVAGCASLMISIIMTVSVAVNASMSDVFEPGSSGQTMVVCISPLLGVALIHFIFKNVLGLPSPFTLKGAMAWGTGIMGGLIGGSVVAGVGSLTGHVREAGSRLAGRLGGKGSGKDPRGGDAGKVDPDHVSQADNRSGDDRSASQQAADSKGEGPGQDGSQAEDGKNDGKGGDGEAAETADGTDGEGASGAEGPGADGTSPAQTTGGQAGGERPSLRERIEEGARKRAVDDARLGQEPTGRDRRAAAADLARTKVKALSRPPVERVTKAVAATRQSVTDKYAWAKAHPRQAVGRAASGTAGAVASAARVAGSLGTSRIGKVAAVGAMGAVAVGAAPAAALAAPLALPVGSAIGVAAKVARGRHAATPGQGGDAAQQAPGQAQGADPAAVRHQEAQDARARMLDLQRQEVETSNATAERLTAEADQYLPAPEESVGYGER